MPVVPREVDGEVIRSFNKRGRDLNNVPEVLIGLGKATVHAVELPEGIVHIRVHRVQRQRCLKGVDGRVPLAHLHVRLGHLTDGRNNTLTNVLL